MPQLSAPTRTLACARCGTVFECALAGDCWCAAEPYRLPLTAEGAAEDCLCPDCLRKAAEDHVSRAQLSTKHALGPR